MNDAPNPTPDHMVVKVDEARWKLAQQHESKFQQYDHPLSLSTAFWFKKHFDDYRALNTVTAPNCLEVGCGKFTNTRVVIPCLAAQPKKLFFEDPLINEYFVVRKRIIKGLKYRTKSPLKEFIDQGAEYSSAPLENLLWRDGIMDLVVCSNVLDHVMDLHQCLREMQRVLKPGGVIVLSQDLSNEEDFVRSPESWTDTMHPIKIGHELLDAAFAGYKILLRKVLSREEGLNPKAHYGTYFLIASKSTD